MKNGKADKMKKKIIACALLACMLLSVSCKNTETGENPTESTTSAPVPVQPEKLTLNMIDDNYRNIYDVNVPVFYDSDSDGVGDLTGVAEKLGYIKELGYNSVVLSSVCIYGDCTNIDPAVGGESGFDGLVAEAKGKGVEVYVDIRPDMYKENVNEYMDGVLSYWLESRGADGLNFSGAGGYYPDVQKNIEFLSYINTQAKKIAPDCRLSGEISVNDDSIINEYYKSGFDSFTVFTAADATGKLAGCLKIHNGEELGKLFSEMQEIYSENANTIYIGSDTASNRPASYMSGIENIKMLAALQMLMNGSVSTFYGDEIGMVSRGGNLLTQMRWTQGHGEGKNYIYAPVDKQMDDDNSIYNFYSEMLFLRNCLPAIARGEVKVIELEGNRASCVIQKTYKGETVTIVINLAVPTDPTDISTGVREVKLGKKALGYTDVVGSVCAYGSIYGASYDAESEVITMPPYSIVVLK